MPAHGKQTDVVVTPETPADGAASGGGRRRRGRPKGSTGARALERDATFRILADGLPAEFTSLDLLKAVYRDQAIPAEMRFAAAAKVLGYEHPRLAAVKHGGKATRRFEDVLAALDDPVAKEGEPAAASSVKR